MLIASSILTIFLLKEASGQLFSRFGFEFPGFSAPEAFDNDGFADIQERIADIMKGSAKPKKGLKTKVKTEQRGDENVTTIEQKGKGFDSWARLTTFGNKKKGESKSFAKMISQMFGGDVKERGNKKSECSGQKPCKNGKYCDPIEGVCKEKASMGERCAMKDQCQAQAICLWGICSSGETGQSGTFCNKDKDCAKDNFCTQDSKISIFQPICKPKLDEGATCGSLNPFGMVRLIIGKRDTNGEAKLSNPCKTGLKCEQVGMFGGMVCVPESMKIKQQVNKVNVEDKKKPKDDKEEDGEEEEEGDDEEEGSGKQDGKEEKPDNEEGGDIIPSKQQENEPEDKPTKILNAKPEGSNDKNKDSANNSSPNGIAQTGQQKPPNGQQAPPIPALNPSNGPKDGGSSKGDGQRKRKHKKHGKRKQKDE